MSEIKWIDGKYHKTCAFSLCNEIAVGRKDKLFCSDQCKNAFHNAISSKVNKLSKGLPAKVNRANRILMRIYKENQSSGGYVVNQITLSKYHFPFDVPTIDVKDDNYKYVFKSFGSFAFYKGNDQYLFIKVKPQLL